MTRWFFGFALALIAFLAGPAVRAETFIPTIYSDGYSCPNNCDAHVVFNSAHNGSKYASSPDSPRTAPVKCTLGASCRICFGNADATCMEAIYRGGGPDTGRFDFTPAFYEANCGTGSLPDIFAAECASFASVYMKFTKNAVYCLAEPGAIGCAQIIKAAQDAKSADTPLWDQCIQIGQTAFNRKYADTPQMQRSNSCAYEKHGSGGPNSRGQHWTRLLPAACQESAFVGRDGLDCCDRNAMSLGGLGRECSGFLAPKQ